MQDPRISIRAVTKKRLKRLAAKKKVRMRELGDKAVLLGLRALSH